MPGTIVAAARIFPKSESVQTPVWACIGLMQLRGAIRKSDRKRSLFNFWSPTRHSAEFLITFVVKRVTD